MNKNIHCSFFAVAILVVFLSLACGSASSESKPTSAPKAECISKTFSGSGDNVIDVDSSKQGGCTKVTLTHAGSENFIVVPYDDQNNRMISYANEVGKYEGTSKWNRKTDSIGIDADGMWTIKVE